MIFQFGLAEILAATSQFLKDLGKKIFIDEVWKWKDESGKKIVNQIKRLGASPDWSRERFTLDKGMSNAVNHVFLSFYLYLYTVYSLYIHM